MMGLAQRHLQPELMDSPALDPQSHARALVALRRINVLSRTAASVWSAIRPLARAQNGRPLRVLDVASGGGDVSCGLWLLARREGLSLDVVGVDMSPVAAEQASRLAAARGADAEFRVHNVLEAPLPGDFDVIVSTLFLHHLARTDAVRLLGAMVAAARQCVVISDLRRSTVGYLLAQAICRLVTRSPIVHVDGPRSVEGAFTMDEVRALCAEAGLELTRLSRSWPCRFLLTLDRH
jgi:2-polyprenyl-3-methyl-5-hydroxy-6-metoxy-1,4-benzoquinol methylase